MIITRRHVFTIPGFSERGGFCRAGSRQWFADHDLSWRDFVRDGIDESVLIEIGDPFALATVAWAHQCEEADHERR